MGKIKYEEGIWIPVDEMLISWISNTISVQYRIMGYSEKYKDDYSPNGIRQIVLSNDKFISGIYDDCSDDFREGDDDHQPTHIFIIPNFK